MMALAPLLALALIAADEPVAPKPPEAPKPAGSPGDVVEDGRSIDFGAQKIPLSGFEPKPWPASLPKVARPRSGGEEPDGLVELSLRDAIRIGLDNSEAIRVIRLRAQSIPIADDEGPTTPDNVAGRFDVPAGLSVGPDGDVVIAPVDRDVSAWKFQADVMAHVRSIEQQYWALWQQQVTVEAREATLKLARDALRRERDEPVCPRGGCADLAEAERKLEDFERDFITDVSDLFTTERQLRNLLGLPQSDGRRIIADTAPVEALVSPDWEASLRAMNASHPDIAQQRVLVRLAELRLLLARNQLLPLLGLDTLHGFMNLGVAGDWAEDYTAAIILRGSAKLYAAVLDPWPRCDAGFLGRRLGLSFVMPMCCGRSPLIGTRQAQYQLLRERWLLRQTVDRATDTLARFSREVEADHELFRADRRLSEATRRRLDAQRAFYEEGRISVDRLLDAAGQQAEAVAKEAESLATYNTAIAALEEAKGTLLAFDKVAIAERPSPRKAYIQAKDQGVTPAAFEAPAGKTFKLPSRLAPVLMVPQIKARDESPATLPSPN